jgi:hypothetical protein
MATKGGSRPGERRRWGVRLTEPEGSLLKNPTVEGVLPMSNLAAVQRPIASLPIAAKISIPGSPDWVGIGANAVWISNAGADSLARIDPSANDVAKVLP